MEVVTQSMMNCIENDSDQESKGDHGVVLRVT